MMTLLTLLATAFGSDGYQIGPGDKLNIVLHGHDLGVQEFQVGKNGAISFPYLGAVQLVGKSPLEAEEALENALRPDYYVHPEITIAIAEYNSARVDVRGAVGEPGSFTMSQSATLRDLLGQAGGVVREEAAGSVVITRNGQEITIALEAIGGPDGLVTIEAGDVIEVKKGVSIFVAGQITTPGPVPYINGITASQAFLTAGAGNGFERMSGSYIIRGDERINVNLKRVLKGKDADVVLRPGDRLVVPTSVL